jgi:hypothetical protein
MWPVDAPPGVVAHEAGHLMGLGEGYDRLPDGPSVPKPGKKGNIMAEINGVPCEDDITGIIWFNYLRFAF